MSFLYSFWEVSLEAAPYLILGFFFAGIIKAFLKDEFISRHLGKNNFASIFKASLFGIPLPLCSCGVIPTALSLRKQGASKPATSSFLISTPESGVDSIALTYGLLGPVFAIIRPVAAFVSALFAGIVESFFPDKKMVETDNIASCCSSKKLEVIEEEVSCCGEKKEEKGVSFFKKIKDGLLYSFNDLMNDISFHLLIGLLLAAAISYFVPETFFEQYLSNDLASLFIMLAVGVPMYICASASTPIAAALILKGLSPGAALVFLMAGPATNLASLTVLQKSLGKATIVRYLLVIIFSSLFFGYLTNLAFGFMDINLRATVMEHKHDSGVALITLISTIILYALIARGVWLEKLRGLFGRTKMSEAEMFKH